MEKEKVEDIYPLSDIEQGMLYHSLLDPTKTIYQYQFVYQFIDKNLNIDLFKRAFALLVDKHQILRTVFNMEDYDQPIQIVYKDVFLNIEHFDVSGLDELKKESFVKTVFDDERTKGFDFYEAKPLWKMKIFILGNDNLCIIWKCHHAITDGWSSASLLTELINTYTKLKTDNTYKPEKLKSSYKNFVIEQIAEKKKRCNKEFWLNELEGYQRLEIFNHGNIKRNSDPFHTYSIDMGTYLFNKISASANAIQTTFKNICFSAYVYIIYSLNYDNDVVVGLVTNNRPVCEDGEKILGCFLNTLPVRAKIPDKTTIVEFIKLIDAKLLKLKKYDKLPLYEIAKIIGDNVKDKNPIFDTMFNYTEFHVFNDIVKHSAIENVTDKNLLNLRNAPRTNMSLEFDVNNTSGQFQVDITYNRDNIDDELIIKIASWYQAFLHSFLSEPNGNLTKDLLLTYDEKQKILLEFNNTTINYSKKDVITKLIEERVKIHSNQVAVIFQNKGITYDLLNQRANQVARQLLKKGVKPTEIIMIFMDRSAEMMIGLLSILKTGAAYLPVSTSYPKDRISYILEDSNVRIVITKKSFRNYFSQKQELLFLDDNNQFVGDTENFEIQNSLYHPAYVIYTSGSTGRPKGVIIEHYGLLNRLYWMQKKYPINHKDIILQKTPVTFDVSVWELFWWAMEGAKICFLIPEGEKDPNVLIKTINKCKITVIHFVPSMLNAFLEYVESKNNNKQLSSLKQVIVSGEALLTKHVELFKKLLTDNHTKLANLYGPTEASIDVSYFDCDSSEIPNRIPIGKPIDNTSLFIVNKNHEIQPVGIAGELVIAGIGLARGYLNRPDLTSDKFINNTYGHHKIIYKTGDMAKWLPDGNIEFIGRIDTQVKIRGNRIEIGEIEHQILKYKGIKEVVILCRKDQCENDSLYAYMTVNEIIDTSKLREFLLEILPGYMIPQYYAFLKELPLSNNGKIDRNALPYPIDSFISIDKEHTLPKNEKEQILVDIWKALLNKEIIGTNDNFFMIGGDSIKAIQVTTRIRKFGYDIDMLNFMKNPIISDLATLLKPLKRIADQSKVVGKVSLTPIQHFFFSHDLIDPHHFNQSIMLVIKEYCDEDVIKKVFTIIQQHHDALRMTFNIKDKEVIQWCNDINIQVDLQTFDIRNTNKHKDFILEKVNEIQASIDLEKGPLMKLGLFHLENCDHLLIAIHHLVIDGLSWRILLEDFELLYQNLKQNKNPELPLKTDSYQFWAVKLLEYSKDSFFLKEREYWARILNKKVPPINKDFPNETNLIKDVNNLSFRLDTSHTEKLITEVNKPLNTDINDILITALGLSIKRVFNNNYLLFAIEGHGREEILENMDISRTIGWFTSIYPVLIDFSYSNDLSRQIKEVKETMHLIPNKGIGYGILKYLTPDEFKKDINVNIPIQIMFNYLGQFERNNKDINYSIITDEIGNTVSLKRHRLFEIEIQCLLTDGQLMINISYNKNQYSSETIQKLINLFNEELIKIISFCLSKKEKELTPSDFGNIDYNIDEFENIFEGINS